MQPPVKYIYFNSFGKSLLIHFPENGNNVVFFRSVAHSWFSNSILDYHLLPTFELNVGASGQNFGGDNATFSPRARIQHQDKSFLIAERCSRARVRGPDFSPSEEALWLKYPESNFAYWSYFFFSFFFFSINLGRELASFFFVRSLNS